MHLQIELAFVRPEEGQPPFSASLMCHRLGVLPSIPNEGTGHRSGGCDPVSLYCHHKEIALNFRGAPNSVCFRNKYSFSLESSSPNLPKTDSYLFFLHSTVNLNVTSSERHSLTAQFNNSFIFINFFLYNFLIKLATLNFFVYFSFSISASH